MDTLEDNKLKLVVHTEGLKLNQETSALKLTYNKGLKFCSKTEGLKLIDTTKTFYLGDLELPAEGRPEEPLPIDTQYHREEMMIFFEELVPTLNNGLPSGTQVILIFSDAYLRSTDGGDTWEQFATPNNAYVYETEFGNGVFIFSCTAGIYASSDYGLTFELVHSDAYNNYSRFTYTEGIGFVGAGGGGAISSPDGFTWTLHSASGMGVGTMTIAHNATRILTGSNGGTFMYSAEKWGTTTLTNSFVSPISGGRAQFFPHENRFVVASGSLQASTDGLAWTFEGTSSVGGLASVLWDGTKFLAGGDTGILTSSNGLSPWSVLVNGLPTTLATARGYLFGKQGSGYVRAFRLATFDRIYTSVDAINWATRILPWGTRYMTAASVGFVT